MIKRSDVTVNTSTAVARRTTTTMNVVSVDDGVDDAPGVAHVSGAALAANRTTRNLAPASLVQSLAALPVVVLLLVNARDDHTRAIVAVAVAHVTASDARATSVRDHVTDARAQTVLGGAISCRVATVSVITRQMACTIDHMIDRTRGHVAAEVRRIRVHCACSGRR